MSAVPSRVPAKIRSDLMHDTPDEEIVRPCRLGYQLGVQLAHQPQGVVTLYPEVLDPLGALLCLILPTHYVLL